MDIDESYTLARVFFYRDYRARARVRERKWIETVKITIGHVNACVEHCLPFFFFFFLPFFFFFFPFFGNGGGSSVENLYSAATSSAAGASAADSVAVAPSAPFFLPRASAPKAGFSFSSPRSNFWSGFVVALSPDRKAAALAESDSPEDFLILAAVLFTRFSWGFMNLPVPSLQERVSSLTS